MDAVKHVLLELGAVWVLWLMAALSLVSAVITIERWLTFRAAGGDLRGLAETLDARLREGDFEAAIGVLGRSRAVAASVAGAGLRLADRGPAAAREAMESRAAFERARLGRRLLVVGTIGNNAPFVGLFGTVVGVVNAFDALSAPATGGTAVASQAVMHGIAEALVATAVGIAVALPAVAAYNYLHRRMTLLLEDTEVLSHLVLAYLSDSGAAKDPERR